MPSSMNFAYDSLETKIYFHPGAGPGIFDQQTEVQICEKGGSKMSDQFSRLFETMF